MTKKAILLKRLLREYNKKENWDYSRRRGYPENTYFGFESFTQLKIYTIREFQKYYGKGLKKLRFKGV